MPGLEVHAFVDRVCYGKSYRRIHMKMDQPYKILGKKHRIFFHDPLSAASIARQFYPNDQRAIDAGYMHILVDQTCTNDPMFKKNLEMLAILDRKQRQSKKKNTKPTSAVERRFLKDLKQLAEIKKLLYMFYSDY